MRGASKSHLHAVVENSLRPILNSLNFRLLCVRPLFRTCGLAPSDFVLIKAESLCRPSKGSTLQGEPDHMWIIIPLTKGSCLHFTLLTPHPGKPRNAL